ncbi:MAG: MFS transporter [Desulfopila sp.]
MNQSKNGVRVAIFSIGILLMGVVGIASGLAEIAHHFSEVSQTSIQLLITLPSVVIIFVNLVIGKVSAYLSNKILVLFGILCFLVGGMLPAVLESFPAILVCRAILGVGIAIIQVLSTVLIAEYFSGEERTKMMGQLSSAQMLGCAFMFFISGHLALLGWNITFYIHSFALLSLICVTLFLPNKPPAQTTHHAKGATRATLTPAAFGWAATTLLFFVGTMTLANYLAFFITDQGLGTAIQAGQATMIFAIGGFLMGFSFEKLDRLAGKVSLAIGLVLGAMSFLVIAFSPNLPLLFLGNFLYGAAVTIVFASIMMETSHCVAPQAVPLAMSIVIMGQNLGSFLCPYIISPLASLLGTDINKYVFIATAIWFAVMATFALAWGLTKNQRRPAVQAAQAR